MCPSTLNSYCPSRQKGFLIPLALFILVGMLAMAITAARLTGQSATSATLEGLSTQAFYAAESGGQLAIRQLIEVPGTAAETHALCDGYSVTQEFPDAPGLQACVARITCSTDGVVAHPIIITSGGDCGSGQLSAQRTIEISAVP